MTCLLGLVALSGCQGAYFASEFHIDFDLDSHLSEGDRLDLHSFHLVESAEPSSDSFEMAKLKHALRNALIEHGLSESKEETAADLVVFYDTEFWTGQQSGTIAVPTATRTVGRAGGVNYSSTAWGTTFVPYSTTVSGRSIWLYALHSRGGSTQVMWKGYVGCEDHFFDDERLRDAYLLHVTEMLLSGQTWQL